MAGPLIGMMRSMGGAMFGTADRAGRRHARRRGRRPTDVGLPLGLGRQGRAAAGERRGVRRGPGRACRRRCGLAPLREAAHQRLFAHVPWLRAHLFGAVEGYARRHQGRHGQAGGRGRPARPAATRAAAGGPAAGHVPAGGHARSRRRRWPAWRRPSRCVEGWVDAVVHAAATPRLSVRRRALRETAAPPPRDSGGPAEQTFADADRPGAAPGRRLRDASRLWASSTDAHGVDGRDGLWAHPDMLPTAADLDDPDGFVHREQRLRLLRAGQDARRGGGASAELRKKGPSEPRTRPRATTASESARRRGPGPEGVRRARTSCASRSIWTISRPIRTACGRPAPTGTSRRAPW